MLKKTVILVLLGIFIFWFSYPFILSHFISEIGDRGLFGDSFGALNTLISGLAFAGIIYTILIQQKQLSLQKTELQLQRKELELTRQELSRSAKAQEKSEEALRQQVENMNLNAKLSSLSTLFNAYQDLSKEDINRSIRDRLDAHNSATMIMSQLVKLTNEIINTQEEGA